MAKKRKGKMVGKGSPASPPPSQVDGSQLPPKMAKVVGKRPGGQPVPVMKAPGTRGVNDW